MHKMLTCSKRDVQIGTLKPSSGIRLNWIFLLKKKSKNEISTWEMFNFFPPAILRQQFLECRVHREDHVTMYT